MMCIMCGQSARYLVNQAAPFGEDCFDPNDPDVLQLEGEGLIFEEIGGDDDSDETE